MSTMQAATDIANAFCAKISACSPFYIQFAYGDVATCESRESALFGEALGASGTGWTPSAVEACVKAVPGATCDDTLGHNLPSACKAPPGQLAIGTACGDNAQCSSAYCNLGSNGKCGTCAASVGSAGAACYRDEDCVIGTVCVGADVTAAQAVPGKCTVRAASGATCDTSHPCQATLVCKSGTCAAPDALSATCSQGTCDALAGDFCNKTTNGTCTKATFAATGGACGAVSGGITACSASGNCTGSPKSCIAPAQDFGTCDATIGADCVPPARCIAHVCTRPTPATCR